MGDPLTDPMTTKASTGDRTDFFLDRTIRDVRINTLKMGRDNPRVDLRSTDPDAFARLKRKIARGWWKPVLVEGPTLEVVAGHQRLEACRDLHRETAPCLLLRTLTEEEKRDIRIEDNTHEGYWSIPQLREQVASIAPEELPLLALDQVTLSSLDLLPTVGDGAVESLSDAETWRTLKFKVPKAAGDRIMEIINAVCTNQKCKPGTALTYITEEWSQDPSNQLAA